jgi:hypothetical protein
LDSPSVQGTMFPDIQVAQMLISLMGFNVREGESSQLEAITLREGRSWIVRKLADSDAEGNRENLLRMIKSARS